MALKSGKKKSKSKKPAAPRKKSGLGYLFWGAATGITLLSLLGILLLPPSEDPAHTPAKTSPESSPGIGSETLSHEASLPVPKSRFTHEEKVGTGFEQRVWEADMAILNVLDRMGKNRGHILRNRVENRFFYGTPYNFQDMHIYTADRQEQFILHLKKVLDSFVANAKIKPQDPEHRKWAISISGHTTHLLHLDIQKPDRKAGTGSLVIIIDDLGECLDFARELAELDFPVTYSILPYLPKTKEVADFASKNGFEVMLHMPMEPETYHRGVEPGPGALFVDMHPEKVRQQLVHSLEQVPQALGVNNHMGSAFTRHYEGMKVVFEELEKRDMFFLDSVTTPDSVAPHIARETGLDFMQRHVFLDNVRSMEAITYQLQKAEQMASRQGMAVAIGHPYRETLEALHEWSNNRDSRINIASVDELILQQRIHSVSSTSDARTAGAN